jgi:hypothetical protein
MSRIGFVCGTVILLFSAANAAEDGCQKFAWPVARERDWFAALDKASVATGESLPAIPNAAFTVRPRPRSEAVFALPSADIGPRRRGPLI